MDQHQLSETQTESANAAIKKSPAQKPLWQVSTVVYVVFATIGLLIGFFAHHNLPEAMHFPLRRDDMLKCLAGGGLSAGVLIAMGFLFEDWFASFREARSAMIRILGPVSAPVAIYLALISAFGEELLFRGALQPYAGVAVTALLFGLLHIGPGGEVSAWAIWAAGAGGLLGWLYQETGTLWTPIIGHFTVNCFSILRLRALYNRAKSDAAEVLDSPPDELFKP